MFKKLLILFSIALVGGFIAGFYYWQQFTSLPEWYQGQDSNPINQNKQTEQQKQKANEEINQLLVQQISEKSQSSQLLRSAKSIQAHLENNQLEIGGVFNPSEIPVGSLDETQQFILDKAIQTFPQLQDLDIYVGIIGQPKVENGRLILDDNSKLRVGKLTFTVDEIAQRFGLAPDKLQQYLELEIAKLNLQGVKINDDTMTLEISQ
jgi:hypothetical protein